MTKLQSPNVQLQLPMTKLQSPNVQRTSGEKRVFDLEDRTLRFAKHVIQLCSRIPVSPINRNLISQLIRASGSVGANYREANDALSKKDFQYRIRIVRKEAKESHYWLQLIAEANPTLNGDVNPLIQEALELKKIFATIADRAS